MEKEKVSDEIKRLEEINARMSLVMEIFKKMSRADKIMDELEAKQGKGPIDVHPRAKNGRFK